MSKDRIHGSMSSPFLWNNTENEEGVKSNIIYNVNSWNNWRNYTFMWIFSTYYWYSPISVLCVLCFISFNLTALWRVVPALSVSDRREDGESERFYHRTEKWQSVGHLCLRSSSSRSHLAPLLLGTLLHISLSCIHYYVYYISKKLTLKKRSRLSCDPKTSII